MCFMCFWVPMNHFIVKNSNPSSGCFPVDASYGTNWLFSFRNRMINIFSTVANQTKIFPKSKWELSHQIVKCGESWFASGGIHLRLLFPIIWWPWQKPYLRRILQIAFVVFVQIISVVIDIPCC